MPEDLGKFAHYLNRSDELLATARKEDIAETARILALKVAHYKARHGELPFDEHLHMLRSDTISGLQAQILAEGFEIPFKVLASLFAPVRPTERQASTARTVTEERLTIFVGNCRKIHLRH
jgi:hypothetical protein